MGFIDSHAHLHFPDYDGDRHETMERAKAAGIDAFINVGTDVESSRKSAELAQKFSNIWATAGVHPHDAKEATHEVLHAIEKILEEPRVVAIGEVGLDFFRNLSEPEKQEEIFRFFIGLHKKSKKPLVVHCRDAYEELILTLRNEASPPYEGIIHCFSGETGVMKKLLDLGFFISFAGPLTYKKNDLLREACRACPLDRLILETDAPFLPPQTKRGKRNEPAYLLETAEVAAELHQLSLSDLGYRTSANTRKVFGL